MTDFDTEWDVDKYYDETEPEAHWDLRKEFMLLHKHRYPEQYLVALAKAFTNVEFLGCSYSRELMALIADLSKEVADSYRKQKSTKLQRTFVKASDAAESKFSVTKKSHVQISSKSIIPSTNTVNTLTSHQTNRSELIQRVQSQEGFRGKIVLVKHRVNDTPWLTMKSAACAANASVKIEATGEIDHNQNKKFNIIIDNEVVADGFAKSEKEAREIVGLKALQNLQQTCFTIERRGIPTQNGESISKSGEVISMPEESNQFSSDNVGLKLMKRMGWTGKGLGKDEDGRENIINVIEQVPRSGFGCTIKPQFAFRKLILKSISEYAASNKRHNLIFSSELTPDERKYVHSLAGRFNLKSKSYGRKSDRQLVISKKITTWEMVEELLKTGDPSSENILIIPTNFNSV